ncbi:hypothetical protein HRV97_03235 [Sphingomonas sp. HHU CXW]|uniref:Uncharacterized protein n=1 Tax=Sphingomonas hominis TaxID=2741495 RepID=A0ABX2JCY8_9SPHN|nr:hypothetical protein [Sphingomonas hominis]NTS64175.1 hypothetical protein [Sphingomonas hominis]
MRAVEYKGILFIEGHPGGAQVIQQLDTKIDGWFSSSQLKSLDHIKDIMVDQAKAHAGNAIIDFKYGQKSTFWRSLFSVDDVYWYATGSIARVDPASVSVK